jgi:hypothetical protein
MSKNDARLTARERATLRLLQVAPWLAFLLLALPAPAYFFLRYLAAEEAPGEWLLVAMTTLGVGALAGLLAAALIVAYRVFWMRRLRERLAADGVTAAELRYFTRELTREERRSLGEIERQHPALAEAYRDTLAARVTAARLLARVVREAETVERKLAAPAGAQAAERATLEADLRADRERLARVAAEARRRQEQAETRLRAIEAAAARGASMQETGIALERLELADAHNARALEEARLEAEARAEIDREMRGARPRELEEGGARGQGS